MPRHDPSTTEKHIILKCYHQRPWYLEFLKNFPGIVGVVLHKKGKKSEKPHLHVFWAGESITSATWKNRARASDERIKELTGVADWVVIGHDSYATWSEYATNNPINKGVEVLIGPQSLSDLLETKKQQVSLQVEAECNAIVEAADARMSEWDRLLEHFQSKQGSSTWSSSKITREIKLYYLQRRRPIPRPGDLTRYSYSLFVILGAEEKDIDADMIRIADEQYCLN